MKTPKVTEPESHIRIAVVAIGSDGCTVLTRLMNGLIEPPLTVALNTDSDGLSKCDFARQVLLGRNIEESIQVTREFLSGVDLVLLLVDETMMFLAAHIAQQVEENEAKCIAVLLPASSFVGDERQRIAENGIANLRQHVTALLDLYKDCKTSCISDRDNFDTSIEIALNFCRAILSCLREGLIGVDFNDVIDVLQGGQLKVGFGAAPANETAVMDAFFVACNSPTFTTTDCATATRILVAVESPKNALKLTALRELAKKVSSLANVNATSIFSANSICQEPNIVRIYVLIAIESALVRH